MFRNSSNAFSGLCNDACVQLKNQFSELQSAARLYAIISVR